jgi:hypothetical protein
MDFPDAKKPGKGKNLLCQTYCNLNISPSNKLCFNGQAALLHGILTQRMERGEKQKKYY